MTEDQMINHQQPELPVPQGRIREQDKKSPLKAIIRFYQIASLFVALTLINSFYQFGNFGAWQILGDISGISISLILLRYSYRNYRIGNHHRAFNLIPFVVFFSYASRELFLSGTILYGLITGLLSLALAYLILRPANRKYWGGSSLVFVFLGIGFSQTNFFNRFNIIQSAFWQISLLVFAIILSILIIWQFILLLQENTIRNRMLASFVMLGLFSTLITAGSTSIIGFQQGQDQVADYLDTVAAINIAQIDTWLNEVQFNLENISAVEGLLRNYEFYLDPTIGPSLQNLTYSLVTFYLTQPLENSDNFRTLSIANTDGEIIASTNPELEGSIVVSQEYFISGSEEYYQSPVLTISDSSLTNLYVSTPIISNTNQFIGVLIGETNTQKLGQILSDTSRLGETGETYLVSQDQLLITPVRHSAQFLPGFSKLETTGTNTVTSAMADGRAAYQNYIGDAVIGNFQWLAGLNAGLITEQSSTEAFESLRVTLYINGVIVLIIVGLAVGIAYFVTQSISDPLSTIAQTATLVASGELDRIEPMERNDEIGELSSALATMTSQLNDFVRNLEEIVAERTEDLERRARYLEATAEIGRAATQIYNQEELLNTVTHQISAKFNFYHVGIFIVDDAKEYALLTAANSEGGWRMLARGHKLRVGEQGIVGYVTGTGKPRIQQQVVGEDSVYYDNPDLPLTRSEMALPITAGGELIGALDVQSTQEEAFSDDDAEILQVLADEVAMAINNARLFEQLQERLEAERRLYGEISQEAWSSILHHSREFFGYRSDPLGVHPEESRQNPDSRRAMAEGQIVEGSLSQDTEQYPLYVPVKVRGDVVIAVLETQKPAEDGPWSSQELQVLEAISEQLGISLENARLFEETQRLAQRERIASDVSGKIWSSSDMDTILQTAVQELGRALDVSQGAIRLKLPDEDDADEKQPETSGD